MQKLEYIFFSLCSQRNPAMESLQLLVAVCKSLLLCHRNISAAELKDGDCDMLELKG